MGDQVQLAAGLIFILSCAVSDIRSRYISMKWIGGSGLLALLWDLWKLYVGSISVWQLCLSTLPGVFLILTSVATKEQIGYGDGSCLLVLGLLTGAETAFLSMVTALMLSSFWSMILLLAHKAEKGSRIPWIPFVMAGYGMVWMVSLA